ncbi:hypothetical protein GUJ93_ZPchr0012g18813 [Zizania palustris]|uniref:Uncharacterized protein n=1 Tax=Zizania palustris TaxID=103762 RepID=A0A8J6BVU8_ZIZPA|nr:hypothetical protein GUJ93_ZPchr0012g18813 [Zizania palustris]
MSQLASILFSVPPYLASSPPGSTALRPRVVVHPLPDDLQPWSVVLRPCTGLVSHHHLSESVTLYSRASCASSSALFPTTSNLGVSCSTCTLDL